jgi:ATP-binding cassette, subfamily F, member 3
MSVLSTYKLSKSFNIFPIFRDVTFQLNPGEKVALVGVNGAGKSTLMQIIAGEQRADSGEIVMRRGTQMAYLPQEATFESDQTLWQEMQNVFGEVRQMQEEIARLEHRMSEHGADFETVLEQYGELTAKFEHSGGYDYETNIKTVLTGLNFPEERWHVPLTQFSGGQKTRAALARALLAGPDLLLLDEPTNHLDLETLEWLESFLNDWKGALLIISHDRYFLDKVVSRVFDLSFGRLEDYPGNYSKYLTLREERYERAVKEYEAQQEFIEKEMEFVRRYKAGQRAKEARGRLTKLNRLARVERPKEKDKLHIALQTDLRSGRLVMAAEELVVGYRTPEGNRTLFSAPELEIERGDRVAIIGPNGCGKSTFLRMLMGEAMPLGGEINPGSNVKIGYYAQSHEGLNFDRTILQEILYAHPMSEGEARNYLGRFLFSGDDVMKKVGALSGGERSRVALARLVLTKANFLVLDEPTNHLDTNAREALEDLLSEYNGTILFVSHDRYFIDALATQVWAVGNGKVDIQLGNYTDYAERVARNRQAANVPAPKAVAPKNGSTPPKNGNASTPVSAQAVQEAKKADAKEERQRQRKVAQLEETIATRENRLTAITHEMTVAGEKQDMKAVSRLSLEYQQVQEEIEKLYAEWGTLAS